MGISHKKLVELYNQLNEEGTTPELGSGFYSEQLGPNRTDWDTDMGQHTTCKVLSVDDQDPLKKFEDLQDVELNQETGETKPYTYACHRCETKVSVQVAEELREHYAQLFAPIVQGQIAQALAQYQRQRIEDAIY